MEFHRRELGTIVDNTLQPIFQDVQLKTLPNINTMQQMIAVRGLIGIHWKHDMKKATVFSEASLRKVAPGAGFCGGSLYRPKNRWRSKKKERSSLQKELVFNPKVCDDFKKNICLSISGFSVSKEKNNKTNDVNPKWWHPERAALPSFLPSDATEYFDNRRCLHWQ